MKRVKSHKIKGMFYALNTAFMQGIEGILFVFMGLFFIQNIFESFAFAVTALAFKELLIIIIMTVLVSPRRLLALFKMLVSEKRVRWFFYAGVCGTTFGNLTYILALQLAGAAYGVVLTALYPVFAILISNLSRSGRKQKEKPLAWIGVAVSMIGASLFVALPSLIARDTFSLKVVIGMLLGGAAGLFWAIEAILINKGASQPSNHELRPNDGVALRSFANVTMTWLVLLPSLVMINFISPGNTAFGGSLKVFKTFFNNYELFLIISAIALNVSLLRRTHQQALVLIGPKLVAVIDTNNFLITPLAASVLVFTHLTFYNSAVPLFTAPVWWTWFLIIPILGGVVLVLTNSQVTKNKQMAKVI